MTEARMNLRYDPADNETFWADIQRIPGFPGRGLIEPLPTMVFESGALFRLTEILIASRARKEQPLLVVMDSTPMQRGSESLKPLVLKILQQAGWQARVLLLEPDSSGQVHTTLNRIQGVQSRLEPDVAALSIGSGTVTDIVKHACYLYEQQDGIHIPFVAYPTANSVSAYTSNMTPLFVKGVKRTVESRLPDGLVYDLETLQGAPREMTLAGVGDLLALYTGAADWYLAYRLGMDDTYNRFPLELLGPLDDILTWYAADIRDLTLNGMAILAKLISLVGLGLSFFHATTPLSGYEHVISHTLDLINQQQRLPLALHGNQVALAVILLSAAYRIFLEEFDPAAVDIDLCYPDLETMQPYVAQIFQAIDPSGIVGAECWSDYHIKLEKWQANQLKLSYFIADWEEIKTDLLELTRPPELIVEILRAAGSPLWFDELKPPLGIEQVKFAFLNSPFIRQRLTLGDLLFFLDWDREALWQRIWDEGQALAAL
jgi:glycerol-1-phosphate dehydrogenase [NAD(P)+]